MICMVFKWKLIRIKTLVSEMRHNNCLISTEGLKKFEVELIYFTKSCLILHFACTQLDPCLKNYFQLEGDLPGPNRLQQLNGHEIDLHSRKINCPRLLDSTISARAQAGAIALKLKITTMFSHSYQRRLVMKSGKHQ